MRNRNYLFMTADLSDALRAHHGAISTKVDGIRTEDFKSRTDDALSEQIVADLLIIPVELDEDHRTMTKEEIRVDVSDDPRRAIFPRGRSLLIPGIRVTVSVPFRGNPELWKLRPNIWRSTVPYGIIRPSRDGSGGTLEIEIEQPADDPIENVKQTLDENMEGIRFYLNNQRIQLASQIPSLPDQVKAAVKNRRERLAKHDDLSNLLGIPAKPAFDASTDIRTPMTAPVMSKPSGNVTVTARWDVFLSHASEDKDAFARPLAEALRERGLQVWFDEFTLRVGDSLRRSIDKGLSASKFGVVVVSPAFLSKEWPQKELDGLVAREIDGHKVILPVWHNIDAAELRKHSPMLADRLAVSSEKGLKAVVEKLLDAISPR
jgi:hypothetical protein